MRGIWHMIESIIAVIIIVSFITIIGSVYIIDPYPKDMSEKAFEMLHGIDSQGFLRNYTESLNVSGMATLIPMYSYNQTFQICDYAGACTGSAPSAQNVWMSTYIVAGLSTYQPREVRLYIWPL